MSKKFNSEEMRKKTLQVRQNQEKDFDAAYQAAFDKVIEGAEEKIQTAMDNGKFRAYLYIWHYLPNKLDRSFTFNNVRILDILTKGDLMERLRDYFDSDKPHGLHVGWHKFQPQKKQAKSKYGIYVSWAERKETSESTIDEADAETVQSDNESENGQSDANEESKEVKPTLKTPTEATTKPVKKKTKWFDH